MAGLVQANYAPCFIKCCVLKNVQLLNYDIWFVSESFDITAVGSVVVSVMILSVCYRSWL